tara:strand:- start:76 stop:261 length:186 start_codon:yes stop_codon:yes gene_type:complete
MSSKKVKAKGMAKGKAKVGCPGGTVNFDEEMLLDQAIECRLSLFLLLVESTLEIHLQYQQQ